MNAMQKHLAAIMARKVEKTNVIGIRKAINHIERLRDGLSGNRNAATIDEVFEIERALLDWEPIVTGELHDTGLKLLRNPRYAKRFDERQRAIIENRHVMFKLVRFDRIGRRGENSVPVYRIVSYAGSFLFRNIPWQSAYYLDLESGPEIVGEDA